VILVIMYVETLIGRVVILVINVCRDFDRTSCATSDNVCRDFDRTSCDTSLTS
jgi:hypothetical protein